MDKIIAKIVTYYWKKQKRKIIKGCVISFLKSIIFTAVCVVGVVLLVKSKKIKEIME